MSKAISRAISSSAWQSLSGLSITALNFLLILLYARVLGPEKFGSLVTSQNQVLIWTLIVDLGLTSGLISTLTFHPENKIRFVYATALLRLLGASAGALLVFAFAYHHALGDTQAPIFWQNLAYIPYLFAFAAQQTAVGLASFLRRQALMIAGILVGGLGAIALSAFLLFRGASISELLFFHSWWGFVTAILIAIGLLRNNAHAMGSRIPRAQAFLLVKDTWRSLWQNSWPFAAVIAVMTIWNRLDQIVTAHYLGLEAGGQYALAARLVSIPILVAASVAFAIFPEMQRLGKDAPEKVALYAGTVLKILFRYGLPVAVVFLGAVALAVAPLVPKFLPAIGLLPWFAAGVWAYWMHSFAINAYWGTRRYGSMVGIHALALATYGAAILPLVHFLGNRGAALTFCLFGFVLLGGAIHFMRKHGALKIDFRLFSALDPDERALWQSILAKARWRKI